MSNGCIFCCKTYFFSNTVIYIFSINNCFTIIFFEKSIITLSEGDIINTDELISLKQDLTLFQEEKISEVLFAPLGEYWSIRFIRAKDGVKIQGNICDKNIIFLQHNLTFNWIVNQNWMHQFQQKIFSIKQN